MLHSIKSSNISFYNYIKYIFYSKSNLTFIEKEIKILNYLKIIYNYFKINFIKIEYNNNIDNKYYSNLSSFLNFSLKHSFSSKNIIYAFICYESYKNFFKKININSKITYLFEMQSWENAMNYAKPNTILSIAYNHTSISKYYIFFFKSKNDFKNTNIIKILPNKIAYNGKYHFYLLRDHYPSLKHKLVESLRFTHLLTKKNENISKNNFDILFLFSINKFETLFMISLINEICNDIRFKKYKLLLKFHPSLKLPIFNKKIEKRISIISDNNYTKKLIKSNYVISGTSSSSIEALYFSCHVLVPDYLSAFFKPPLCDHKKYFKSFKSIDELNRILSLKHYDQRKTYKKFARDYWFIDYNKPKRLIDYINE